MKTTVVFLIVLGIVYCEDTGFQFEGKCYIVHADHEKTMSHKV